MIGHRELQDQYAKNYGFRIEIKPGPPVDATHGGWKSVRGGGVRIHEATGCTTGKDKFKNHTRGIAEWDDLVLRGAVTADRTDMQQWFQDMVDTGDEGACYRDVTVTFLGPNGEDTHSIDYLECFLCGYSMSSLDGDADAEEAEETIEICVGYSSNFLC
jgi:hypothetical protein